MVKWYYNGTIFNCRSKKNGHVPLRLRIQVLLLNLSMSVGS